MGGIRGYLYTHFIFYQITSKYLITLCLLTPLFLALQNAHAVVKIDSVYADYCYLDAIYAITPGDSAAMFHKRDSVYGQLTGNGPLIDMASKKFNSASDSMIVPESAIIVWGEKDVSADSSAGKITFNIYNDLLGRLITSSATILNDGVQVVTVPQVPGVPNGHWDYVELTLAGNEIKHATSYFIDAVALVQDTTTSVFVPSQPLLVHSISSYPNPFIANTTIHFALEITGEVQLVVIDGLGRETDRVIAGYLESGVHEIPLAVRTPGFYFVRLFVNGQPVGNPLKITSR